VGLWDRFSTGTRVIGGYWGTLPVGLVFERAMNPIVDEPYFINSQMTDWSGSEEIQITGSVTNASIRMRGSQEVGWNYRVRNRSTDEFANNSIWYGPNPIEFKMGLYSNSLPNIIIQGGTAGSDILTLSQNAVTQKMGFSVTRTSEGGKLVVRDQTANRPIANFQQSLTLPRVLIGADSFGTARPYTNAGLGVGRWASSSTNNAAGYHLKISGGNGTGTGDPGLVTFASFENTGSGSNSQTVLRDVSFVQVGQE